MKKLLLSLLTVGLVSSANGATVTAYCHCKRCNGKSGQPTASGVMPRVGITVAGPRHIPFGTRVFIPGLGVRIVQDRTHKKFDGRWDVFMTSHQTARQFGKQQLTVTILK